MGLPLTEAQHARRNHRTLCKPFRVTRIKRTLAPRFVLVSSSLDGHPLYLVRHLSSARHHRLDAPPVSQRLEQGPVRMCIEKGRSSTFDTSIWLGNTEVSGTSKGYDGHEACLRSDQPGNYRRLVHGLHEIRYEPLCVFLLPALSAKNPP